MHFLRHFYQKAHRFFSKSNFHFFLLLFTAVIISTGSLFFRQNEAVPQPLDQFLTTNSPDASPEVIQNPSESNTDTSEVTSLAETQTNTAAGVPPPTGCGVGQPNYKDFCCAGGLVCIKIAGNATPTCEVAKSGSACYSSSGSSGGSGSGGNTTGGTLGAFNITSVTMSCNSVQVAWSASTNAVNYRAELYKDPSQAPLYATTTTQRSANLIKALEPNGIYYVSVTAQNSNGAKKTVTKTAIASSSCTAGSSGGTTGGSTSAPGTFTANAPVMSCDSARLSWNASSGASYYVVETYENGPGGTVINKSGNLTQRSHTVTGLKPRTIYTFVINAHNSVGRKMNSQTAATTSSCTGTGGTISPTGTGGGGTISPTGTGGGPISPTGTGGGGGTTTPGASSLVISLDLTLPGIGASSSGNNPTPSRPQRNVSVAAVNSTGGTTTATGNITFDSSSNSYKGTVTVTNLSTGTYTIKVRVDNSLWKKAQSTVSVSGGSKTFSISNLQLVTGDLDQNNSLTAADYTTFVACYKGLPSCSATLKTLADLNDNTTVDLLDLNILQRGFRTRNGD